LYFSVFHNYWYLKGQEIKLLNHLGNGVDIEKEQICRNFDCHGISRYNESGIADQRSNTKVKRIR
jgi:hypothetical protein